MSNFDDIFAPVPQDDFDKELGRRRKKPSVTIFSFLPTPPQKKSAQTAANSVNTLMCRRIFAIIPPPTPF